MTPYDKTQIWNELKRLDKEKANTCPVKDMSNRINYLETNLNWSNMKVRELQDEVQRLDNETTALTRRCDEMQEHVQEMGRVLQGNGLYE